MRALVQRVACASVEANGARVAEIGPGLLVFVGVTHTDTEQHADKLWNKIRLLRIFADEMGLTNRSLEDVGGSVLLVSQFTLYADTRKGHRPSFVSAAGREQGARLYEHMVSRARADLGDERVGEGIFGADMQVALVNDGPFTVTLEV